MLNTMVTIPYQFPFAIRITNLLCYTFLGMQLTFEQWTKETTYTVQQA